MDIRTRPETERRPLSLDELSVIPSPARRSCETLLTRPAVDRSQLLGRAPGTRDASGTRPWTCHSREPELGAHQMHDQLRHVFLSTRGARQHIEYLEAGEHLQNVELLVVCLRAPAGFRQPAANIAQPVAAPQIAGVNALANLAVEGGQAPESPNDHAIRRPEPAEGDHKRVERFDRMGSRERVAQRPDQAAR